MYGLYNSFNFLTGYKEVNPSVQSIEWRLIVLESVAGVPGFVAAGNHLEVSLFDLKHRKKHIYYWWHFINLSGFRHFRSLRTLERDRGWIATLLEEAENERMHLLLCLNKFRAGKKCHTSKITTVSNWSRDSQINANDDSWKLSRASN